MYRVMLLLCAALMVVLLVTASMYFFALGASGQYQLPDFIDFVHFIPQIAIGLSLGIGFFGLKFVMEKHTIDDRVADNPIVVIVLGVLYIPAIILMVIASEWAAHILYGHY